MPTASTSHNKSLVRRFYAAFDAGELDAAFGLLGSDYVVHVPGSQTPQNLEGYRQSSRQLLAAFPDLQHVVEDQVAEDDKVVVRLTVHGTHTGNLGDLPPTARRIAVAETAIFRVVADHIVEQWPQVDALSMMQQVGALPSAPRAS